MANVILRVKREDGSWAEIPALVGPEGPQGVSIDDIVLKSQEGGVSTYLILLSDGSEKTFQVTDGAIITDVSLISTDVLIDTYKISISDGSFFNFKVTNGRGIKSIAKTSTDVLSDTYTISYNDNTSSTFKVTNGRSITKIVKSSTNVLTDTYTISYNDNTTSTYTITNGRGIDYIEKDETIGLSDRYTIHYNDGSTSYYHVVNGEAGPAGSIGNRIYLSGLVDKVNDEEGYGRVKELKESDFDLSKFIVVGSPLISEDGVASGFTANNYLAIQSVDVSKPFKFSGTFTTGADIYHSQAVFGSIIKSTQFLILGVHSDGYPVIYYPRTAGDSWIKLSRIVSANTTYHYTLTFDGTNLTFNLTDGASYNLTITPTNFNASGLGVIPTLYIGRNASGAYIMQPDATIDLNSFKIYVDGNLVYQPCLKIPYTQSKTGSKIVDDVYRERVQDMYEQCGYTHYYTLGDEDYTLATCKGSDVVESADNYEQTADLTLKQWGSATSGQTVNLLPYKDTNYAVTLANRSKTKSSFVANATGDYFAVGKTVLG